MTDPKPDPDAQVERIVGSVHQDWCPGACNNPNLPLPNCEFRDDVRRAVQAGRELGIAGEHVRWSEIHEASLADAKAEGARAAFASAETTIHAFIDGRVAAEIVKAREEAWELAAQRAHLGYERGQSCDDIERDIRALCSSEVQVWPHPRECSDVPAPTEGVPVGAVRAALPQELADAKADAKAEGAREMREACEQILRHRASEVRVGSHDFNIPTRATREQNAAADELDDAADAIHAALAEAISPAMDLLRKFATGEGGRRTGDLMRRDWIRVEVTEAGHAALAGRTRGGG